jgi:hypothetical protein
MEHCQLSGREESENRHSRCLCCYGHFGKFRVFQEVCTTANFKPFIAIFLMGCVTFRLLSTHKHASLITFGHPYNLELHAVYRNLKKISDKLRYAKIQMVTFQCYRFLRDLTQKLKVENNHHILSQLNPNLI